MRSSDRSEREMIVHGLNKIRQDEQSSGAAYGDQDIEFATIGREMGEVQC